MVKYLGLAGVEEAGFDVGAGVAAGAVRDLAKLAGSPLLTAVIEGGGVPTPVEVLAFEADGKRRIWVVNLTGHPQAVTVAGLGVGAEVRIERGAPPDAERPNPQAVPAAKGEITLELAPFEVCRLTAGARGSGGAAAESKGR